MSEGSAAPKETFRVGDRFTYGQGKGVWEVTEVLPGGKVWLIDRARSLQTMRYTRDMRYSLSTEGYKRIPKEASAS